jgi:hypothetical protein
MPITFRGGVTAPRWILLGLVVFGFGVALVFKAESVASIVVGVVGVVGVVLMLCGLVVVVAARRRSP